MEYTTLGHTDLSVSRLAFGGGPLSGYDWGQVDEREAIAAVRQALDLGITLFDTADAYGLGSSEERLSKALGPQRHEVVIATKFGVSWEENPRGGRARTFLDSSAKRVVEALEQSLRRLRVDSIPLYQVHWPDPKVPAEETMTALVRCQEEGKIQHIGYSNATPQILSQVHQIHPLVSLQVPYNLGCRAIEQEIIPLCMRLGVGVLVYGPLAQGLLTGKYDRQSRFGQDDQRHRLRHFHGAELERYLWLVDRLFEVAHGYGKSLAQVALRWVLDKQAVTSVIMGVKTPAQAVENAGAMGWNLSAEDLAYLETDRSTDL